MNLRSIALYLSAPLMLLVVFMVLHRKVGELAPAPPVDVSNVPYRTVTPIPLPAEETPTILQSHPDDGEIPQELRDAIASRPEAEDDNLPLDTSVDDPLSPLPRGAPPLLPIPDIDP